LAFRLQENELSFCHPRDDQLAPPLPVTRLLGMGRKKRNPSEWTATELAMLGVETDNYIAKATKRNTTAVRIKRIKLGIPPAAARGAGPLRWGPSDLAFFRFGYSDKQIAKFTGRPIKQVKAKRAELVKG
jgi:hypothetical protein